MNSKTLQLTLAILKPDIVKVPFFLKVYTISSIMYIILI